MRQFINDMSAILPLERIITDELLCYAYSTDASMYRMVPQVVLLVENESEVRNLIQLAAVHGVKLTFRAAGTSLSGQAVTDQVLVVLSGKSWQKYAINSDGSQIALQPGIIGAQANQWLSDYKRQIGPDPASINAAKIGGIIANNSSGMCCGTSKNSYATLVNLRAVFANGALLDSEDVYSVQDFYVSNPELIAGITQLHYEINQNDQLSAFIRKKFAIKNTSGYSLNAFLDYSDPIKIIERLLIGSEGTLGFVSQVTLNTVSSEPYKTLNMLYAKVEDVIALTVQLADCEVSAIEMLDAGSLRSVAHIRELQPYLIPIEDDTTAIMIELAATDNETLQQRISAVEKLISQAQIIHQSGFVSDKTVMANLWQARKGVLPTIAGQRPLGSTVLIEDVAVEMHLLPALIKDLREMFGRYGYDGAAIFGHVLAGNVHFVLTPNFSNESELLKYDQFMQEMATVVGVKYNGSLKAEHGSGRNISPFALVEWGEECWNIMWRIKELFDPQNIFNPEVKLTRDNTLHLHNLKQLPAVDELIDKCMECGFCEPVCPSRNLSLTPRQRNAVARKIAQLTGAEKKVWQDKFAYYGIETCASTGMCQTACPVAINSGDYILSLRQPIVSTRSHSAELAAAKLKVKLAGLGSKVIGAEHLEQMTRLMHAKRKNIPLYLKTMPNPQSASFINSAQVKAKVVTLAPACPNRVFAASQPSTGYPPQKLLEKMGYAVNYLPNLENTCCGQMYHSHKDPERQQQVQHELRHAMQDLASVLTDNSSCAGFARECEIPLVDINQFVIEHLERGRLQQKYRKIALHIDCSTAKHGFNPGYLELLQCCAKEVVVPEGIKCCGFAGDKGFSVPELNASSLATLGKQVAGCEIGVTFNRNCQIGLSYHSDIVYISLVELLLECLV